MRRPLILLAVLLCLVASGCTQRARSLLEPGEYELAYDALLATAKPAEVKLARVTADRLVVVDGLDAAWTYEAGAVQGPTPFDEKEHAVSVAPLKPEQLRVSLAPLVEHARGKGARIDIEQENAAGEVYATIDDESSHIMYRLDGRRITVDSFLNADGWSLMCSEVEALEGQTITLEVRPDGYTVAQLTDAGAVFWSRVREEPLRQDTDMGDGDSPALPMDVCGRTNIVEVLARAGTELGRSPDVVRLDEDGKLLVGVQNDPSLWARCDPAGKTCAVE